MIDTMGLKVGAMLRHDTYRIEKILGQGGFGITYLATDINLDKKVAIKEFFPKNYCDRDDTTSQVTLGTQGSKEFVNKLKNKFLKEARNIAKFDYPSIIKIHAAFEENNTAYYVMDYIEGLSLSEMLRRNGALPEAIAIEYISKVGEALEYVHSHKMNHLDIKPANIVIRESDNLPILIDFGMSKQYDPEGNQTSTTPIGLSHGYAPMEQYNDGGIKLFSPQTDVYSLAATLYFILSGVIPPQATRLIEDELTFPVSIPTRLIAPISKAMSVSRKMRHETVAEFISDIKGDSDHEETVMVNRVKSTYIPPKEPEANVSDYYDYNDEAEPKSKLKKILNVGIIFAVLIASGIYAFSNPNVRNYFGIGTAPTTDSIGIRLSEVNEMIWESPLGKAIYTGSVMQDTIDHDKFIPHGKGHALITLGEFTGSIYEGEFNKGKFEGETNYRQANGDTFEGHFKDNQYDTGKYTIKSTGEYFDGSFENGQPSKGQWYNKNGKKI